MADIRVIMEMEVGVVPLEARCQIDLCQAHFEVGPGLQGMIMGPRTAFSMLAGAIAGVTPDSVFLSAPICKDGGADDQW